MLDIFVCFQSMWIFYVWMYFQYESISMSRSSKKVEDFYFHENKVFKAFRSCTQFSSLSCVYKNISWILFLCVLFLDSGRDSTNNGKVATEKRGWMIYKLILMVLLWITRKEIFFCYEINLQLFTHVMRREHSIPRLLLRYTYMRRFVEL